MTADTNPHARPRNAIAIIGMACLYPGARDVDQFWQNILRSVDAVTDPPLSAWDPDVYYDPDSMETDRIYVKKGGYIEDFAKFDPLPFGVPPKDVGGEPDQWLALKLARDALIDAGYADAAEEVRHRTAVILGRGLYPNAGSVNAVQHTLIVTQTLDIIKTLQPDLSAEELEAIRSQLKASLPKFGADTAPALTPNMITGRIANRLDLMGPNYTVDAACASSLIAMKMASRELLNGDCDMALAGGSQVWTSMPILGVFGQMGALSHSGRIRPFDKNADGTILGEGIAFLVLKRLADAERDKDRIYAVIRGIGVASDGRASGLMAPRVEGQVLAMQRAYKDAGVGPETIKLIEAHGTGTPLGDTVEVKSMTEVFGARRGELPDVAIGSVKSMIGHTMPAAGAAGLIKASLSLYHKVLPPTLNCEEPNPELGLDQSPFYINTTPRPWVSGHEHPRRAGVSAFGFGGINSHVVLEEYTPPTPVEREATPNDSIEEVGKYLPAWDSELCVLTGATREALAERATELCARLEAGEGTSSLLTVANALATKAQKEHPHRLAIVAMSLDDLLAKATRARDRLATPDRRQIREAAGVYYTSTPLRPEGKVAFLFPGEGSQYVGMLSQLALHFPEARTAFDEMDALHNHKGGTPPSRFLHPRTTATESELEASQAYLWTMNGAVSSVLASDEAMLRVVNFLGIQPDAVAGHSSGEYAALRTAGVFSPDGRDEFESLAKTLLDVHDASLTDTAIEASVLLACGTDRETAESLLSKANVDGFVAMDNCPNQVVIVAREQGRDALLQAARERAIIVEVLKFDRPYHTPWFGSYSARLRDALAQTKLSAPSSAIYSCATASTVTPGNDDLHDLIANQWSKAVEFRGMIERMYDDGFRMFLEIGPGNHLTAFVEDILRGKKIGAYATNIQQRSDLTQLNHVAGQLFVHGVDVDVEALSRRRIGRGEVEARPRPSEITLVTGFSSMKLDTSQLPARRSPAMAHPATVTEVPATGRYLDAVPESNHTDDSAFEEEHSVTTQASPPQQLTPVHTARLPVNGDLAAVTHRFLETMDHFLAVQERVLLAYLGSGADADSAQYTSNLYSPVAYTPPATPPAYAANGIGHSMSAAGPAELAEQVTSPVAEPATARAAPASPISLNGVGGNGTNGVTPAQTEEARPPLAPAFAQPDTSLPSLLPELLRQIVSDRTGYPPEVIDVDADLEADLGIDSIKRVEILGTLRSQQPSLRDVNLEQLTVCRTIQQIVDVLAGEAGTSPFDFPSAGGDDPPAEGTLTQHSLLGTVTHHEPGQSLTTRLVVDPEDALWLKHHTIGRGVSLLDETLTALPVMPLALSLELMAQAAVALVPGHVVTRIEHTRAKQWIEFGDGPRTLEVRAERSEVTPSRFHCQILLAGAGDATAAVEAEVLLEPQYPVAPAPRFVETVTPSRYRHEDLYEEVMYHGPTWRAVSSITGSATTSLTARLAVPSALVFRTGTDELVGLTDPIALDAAGQLIGFWTAEHLEEGRLVFPVTVSAIEFFSPPSVPGDALSCTVSISNMDDLRVQADFDVAGASGVQFRVSGWLDRRFHIPAIAEPVVRPRSLPSLATELDPEALGLTADAGDVHLKLQAELEDDTGLLRRIWASRIRSGSERSRMGLLVSTTQDLFAEHLAKEAVCRLVKKNHEMELLPADVELISVASGEVHGVGTWSASLSAQPAVWLSRRGHTLVAIATWDRAAAGAKRNIAERLLEYLEQRV